MEDKHQIDGRFCYPEGRRGVSCPPDWPDPVKWRNVLFNFVCSLWKRHCLLLLALLLLCGCGSLSTSQAFSTPTAAAQTAFTSYVGKWQVHDELLTIHANSSGLLQWNAGPCSAAGQRCNGNAHITFTEQTDGSIKGTIQSVSYSQWNGDPAPRGYQPNAEDQRTGDTFQLQHSGAHLLYTTWFGEVSALNNTNRSWCDPSALSAGWRPCGA